MSKTHKLVKIEVTMQEIWHHTMPRVQKSKKEYKRKPKHKNHDYSGEQ